MRGKRVLGVAGAAALLALATWGVLSIARGGAPSTAPSIAGPAPSAPPAEAPRLATAPAPAAVGAGSPEAATPPPAGDAASAAEGASPLGVRVTVEGTVREGATVRLRRESEAAPFATGKTDAKGVVRFPAVDRRGLRVEALAEGARAVRYFDDGLEPGEDGLVEIDLSAGVPVPGRVVDAKTSAPVAGASVISDDVWQGIEVGPTDEEGRFRVPGAGEGSLGLTVRASGFVPARVEVQVEDGKFAPADLVVRLARGARVDGTVVSADGAPVGGAKVEGRAVGEEWPEEEAEPSADPSTSDGRPYTDSVDRFQYSDDILRSEDGIGVLHGVSAADGTFSLDGAKFGETYVLRAARAGHATSSWARVLVPEAAAPSPTSLRLRRGAVVLLRAAVPVGGVLPEDARVRLFQGEEFRAPDGRDPDGRFRFADVPPGRTTGFVQATGFRLAAERTVVREGETVELTVALEGGAAVEGVVVGADGKPVAGARIRFAAAKGNERRTAGWYLSYSLEATSDAQGAFRIAGVAPGESLLGATADGELATRTFLRFVAPARDLRVVVLPLGSVRIRLVTPDGKPYQGGVSTGLFDADGSGGGGGSSVGHDGVWESAGVYDGEHVVRLLPKGFAWFERKFTVKDGAAVDLGEVRLDPGFPVTGRVVDAAGKPLPAVEIACSDSPFRQKVTHSDASGRFTLENCPRTPIHLTFHLEPNADVLLLVDPEKGTPVDVQMSPPTRLKVVVRWPAGQTPEEITLELRRPDSRPETRQVVIDGAVHDVESFWDAEYVDVDASGRFEGTLPAGRWLVFWDDTQVAEWKLAGAAQEIELKLPVQPEMPDK